METGMLLWFFLWRTSLLGLVLGAVLAGAYRSLPVALAMIISTLTEETLGVSGPGVGLGWVVGTFLVLGAAGAAVGFVLGTIAGLLGALLTRLLFPRSTPDVRAYRRAVGAVCAGSSAVVLLTDWLLHDFPNANGFILSRLLVGVFGEDTSAVGVFIQALVPTLLFSSAIWWAGRKVAGRYAQEAGSPRGDEQTPISGGSPMTH
jgi:hypothetical protein